MARDSGTHGVTWADKPAIEMQISVNGRCPMHRYRAETHAAFTHLAERRVEIRLHDRALRKGASCRSGAMADTGSGGTALARTDPPSAHEGRNHIRRNGGCTWRPDGRAIMAQAQAGAERARPSGRQDSGCKPVQGLRVVQPDDRTAASRTPIPTCPCGRRGWPCG